MRCDIVIATWNAIEMTRTALASVQRESGYPYRLILVDNSDQEDARAWFRQIAETQEFGETLLIQNPANVGWLKATNIGLRRADAEFACLLNNDVVCGTDWLKRCVAQMQAHADIGMVCPRGNERSENERVKDVNAYARQLGADSGGRLTEIHHGSGYCMVVRRRLFDELGLLDEIFDGGYWEDYDFSCRVWQSGHRCVQADDAYVMHLGSQSFKLVPEGPKRAMHDRNREICLGRWGTVGRELLLVDRPGVSAAELIERIRRTRTYLVVNRHVPPEVLAFRHQHLALLPAGVLGARLTFALRRRYLEHKRRIDAAIVLGA